MRRRVLHSSQVMLPFVLIITASVAILIIWQTTDPLEWYRELLDGYLVDHPWESYGQCGVSNQVGTLPYIIPLGLLFLVTMLMTLSVAWKMRMVQSDLSEARWIFIAVSSHIQIWLVGIPVFLILEDISRDASYLISMALIFVLSNVFVVLVIWPKMLDDIGRNGFGLKDKDGKTTHIGVKGGSMHITGLRYPSGFINSPDQSRSFVESSRFQGPEDELEKPRTRLEGGAIHGKNGSLPAEDNGHHDDESLSGSHSARLDAAGQIHISSPRSNS
eukprot:scaffold2214_cov139-Cylindrotheca_fusiformis.AAC.14